MAALVTAAAVVSATAAASPAAVVAPSVVAVAALLDPASAGGPLVHQGHSVEEGLPAFVPSSHTCCHSLRLFGVWSELSDLITWVGGAGFLANL